MIRVLRALQVPGMLFFLLLVPGFAEAGTTDAGTNRFAGIADVTGPSDTVAVSGPGGEPVYAKNADTMRVPASIAKILTALVAFEHLGPEYRFPTEFYTDGQDNLVVKGYGDPFLVSESVAAVAGVLSGKIDTVNNLVMDASYFDDLTIPGTRAGSHRSYDAPAGALCVNFNTVFFDWQNGAPVSAEPQTPLLPLAEKRIRAMGADAGRILLSPEEDDAARYAGELFAHFLRASGVDIRGNIRIAAADPENLVLVHRHFSDPDVREMVKRMMAHSNNFIANQLLLAAGAKAAGAPATLEKGVSAARKYAAGLGIFPEIAEGSGISRKNRITAEMMLRILDAFAPHYRLLQKRGRVFFKTGTLAGIQTRAGYIQGVDGRLYRFAVMMETPGMLADPVVERLAENL